MERMKNMGLKKSFFILATVSILVSLAILLTSLIICESIRKNIPSGGLAIDANGTVTVLEEPTEKQKHLSEVLTYIQICLCIFLPVLGLGVSGILFYQIKLKLPISVLRAGTERIRNHNLDFSIPEVSMDELGQICAAFEKMRAELLKTNQELWRQTEERKRLNAAFSHDLRNPVTVIKGTVKLLKQGIADDQALERLESYTLRIEQYVEAMSSIQRLEQMPVRINECTYTMLRSELEDTVKLFAPELCLSISAPDEGSVQLDHGLFLNVAENLISNAVRFARSKIQIQLVEDKEFLSLSVIDDGSGYPAEIVQNGPKPFGKLNEDTAHFGMGLYSSGILCIKHGGVLKLENIDGQGAMATAFFQINLKS